MIRGDYRGIKTAYTMSQAKVGEATTQDESILRNSSYCTIPNKKVVITPISIIHKHHMKMKMVSLHNDSVLNNNLGRHS